VSSVQSIERAFAVLEALSAGPAGITGIAGRTGLPKSTVARLLSTLVGLGAAEQVPGDVRYRLGVRLDGLTAGVRSTRGLAELAHPGLADLAAAAGEAAGLSVPDGWTMHYVDQVDAPNPVQVRDWTGSRIPMHAVSSGQVVLAFLPAPAVARFLAMPLDRFTARTLDDAEALLARLREIRQLGYAWAREEYAEGITSVAAPIAGSGGEVVAALHVHGPSYRFPRPGLDAQVSALVVEQAARISRRLRRAGG
jgi:IclR family acetate operon transcriptional repressor